MKVRKQEQVDAFRQRILDTAKAILCEEGIEQLSIRKITKRLDYTPGILYHYFKNKDEIIQAIVAEGYGEILHIIRNNQKKTATQSENLVNTLRAYMEGMLERRIIFMLIMKSKQAPIRSQVDILQPNIREHRESINALCKCMEDGVTSGEFICEHVELRAQTIWCATYGLMTRICTEEVQGEFQKQLIEEHLQMILDSLRARR